MSKNYMTLELGGKVRGLKFNIATLKYLRDVTGIDPLKYKAESNDFDVILPYATNILHAALLSNCLSKKEEPDFTAEDVPNWINELSGGDLSAIIQKYTESFTAPNTQANGEVGKDTQLVNV